ncbi:hypothetical protein GOP47_0009038 [Adiantum capillus-veneris]|uniref:Pentatricopeptide repeat-containing protein n=1 Tax=Adiantum capillus-veneris TaxID=13818 RepID=A0A9D4ZIL0_ADICA|nr:hypothetical protein GOP47_0009038 [Adiantum capillus-veneris]
MLLNPSGRRVHRFLFKQQNLASIVSRSFTSSVEHAPTGCDGGNELLGHSNTTRIPFDDYLHQFHLSHASLDSSAFALLLQHCADERKLLLGMFIHSLIVECGVHHITYVANFLLQMYSRCEALSESLTLFIAMYYRNGFSWNLIIRALARAKQSKEAVRSFHRMQEEAILPSKITYVSALDACANEVKITLAHQMHTRIESVDLGAETVVWDTALLNMYGKCNSLKYVRIVFDKMQEKNVVSWTTIISVCEQLGRGRVARGCFQQMQQEGILPNKHTFVSVLASCAGDAALAIGSQVHACLHISGLDRGSVTGSALIIMYGKCDSLADAEMVFDQLITRNIVAWTAMIETYAQNGHGRQAFSLYYQMQHEGIVPNKSTYIGILGACVGPDMLDAGKNLHDCIRKRGFELDAFVGTSLINMYAKCRNLKAAEALFVRQPKWDVVFWNSMIGAYASLGMVDLAIETFDLMQMASVNPNKVTFLNLLVAFSSQATMLREGRKLHSCIIESDLQSDSALASTLINLYGKCASLDDALEVFDKLADRNVCSWSSMINAYATHGFGKKALRIFAKMQEEGIPPNKITLMIVLVACSQAGLLDEAYDFFVSIAPDCKLAPILQHYVCMVGILGKAGRLDDIETLIKHMPFQPGSVPFTTFMAACHSRISVEQGAKFASPFLELDRIGWVPYLLLAYLYTTAGQNLDVAKLSMKLKEKLLEKEAQSSKESVI